MHKGYLILTAIFLIGLFVFLYSTSQHPSSSINNTVSTHNLKTYPNASSVVPANPPSSVQYCTQSDPNVAMPNKPHGLFYGVFSLSNVGYPSYVWTDNSICGAYIAVSWASIDKGPGANPQYNWNALNNVISTWAEHGKPVSIVFTGVSESNVEDTPAYVLANVPTVQCVGDPAQGVPVYWDGNYFVNYENFMKAAVAQYGNNPSVLYMRFGLGAGGESFPDANYESDSNCPNLWAPYGLGPASSNDLVWIQYTTNVIKYMGSLNSNKLMVSLESESASKW